MAYVKHGDKAPYQHYDIDLMIQQIEDYLAEKEKGFPILKECCLQYGWSYDTFMRLQRENPDLREAAERLLMTKEVALEKGGLLGKFDRTVVVFSLKQLGWRDKIDLDVKHTKTEVADTLEDHFAQRQSDADSGLSG